MHRFVQQSVRVSATLSQSSRAGPPLSVPGTAPSLDSPLRPPRAMGCDHICQAD